MLTLIKLVHTLNRRIDFVSNRHRFGGALLRENYQAKIRFQAICAVIALSLAGLGRVEVAQSKSLDFAGIRQSLELTANHQLRSAPVKFQTAAAKPQPDSFAKRLLGTRGYCSGKRDPTANGTRIAQNTPPPAPPASPVPPAPIPNRTETLKNRLDFPQTGAEVQITDSKALTLQETLDIAFRNNREVQAARLTVTRSQSGISEAQAAQAVQVGLTSSLRTQGSPLLIGETPRIGTSSSTDIQGTVEATYSLANAGRDTGRIRAAQEQVNFDRLDLLRVEQKLRGDVLTAYYDLQEAGSAVIINNAAVVDATRSLSDAQLQEKAGVGTKFDILRAQVQLATANQDLTRSQGQQQTSQKKIAQLLSVNENTEYKAADTVKEQGTWNYSLEDSLVVAFKNRPELRQQLVRRSVSEQQQIVASAADSAQVSLFANYTLGKTISATTPLQDNYSAGARLSWNFWDGGAAGSRSNQEKVNQEIYENQFTTTRNQIRFEIEQAYNNLGTNKKNIVTSTQALKQAEESLKLARLRFQAGVGTQTDVIQAQTELARARGNRITAIINYNRSLSILRTATVLRE
jgi:outer membrane protein TolC